MKKHVAFRILFWLLITTNSFAQEQVCDLPPLGPPVTQRIENRTFPSVFQAWGHVQNMNHLPPEQRYALHDLFFSPMPHVDIGWDYSPPETPYGIRTSIRGWPKSAIETRQRWLGHNPNMVLLGDMNLSYHLEIEAFPPDSDFWMRDAQGQILQNDVGEYRIDFYNPEVQDLFAKRIIATAQCGIFDGIMLDSLARGADPEIWNNVFRTVRSQVHDDFLILVNANRDKLPHHAKYINGTFMETGKDYEGGYTHEGLKEIESTLIWSEQNFRHPQINCLEGWGMSIEPPDGPNNLRWMRLFTTMSLTCSDGYVLYTTGTRDLGGPHHEHLWHSFWNANLGRPVGAKAKRYRDIKGIYIREFTNGWAVYNRSGKEQAIALPRVSIGVSSNKQEVTHLLPDLDGEIYLRIGKPYDLNRDGTINILDLIIISQHFGTAEGDINGDGTTDILDLTLVAQRFNQ